MVSESISVVALQEAIAKSGGQASLARLIGVTQQAVSKWVRKQQKLPPEHVLAVETATGISRHDLRPDIYPRPAALLPVADSRFEHAS